MPRVVRRMARTAAVVGTATAVSGNVRRRQDARHSSDEQPAAQQEVASSDD